MDTTITLNLTNLLAFCVGFTTLCVAGSWLIKMLSPLKKPVDDMKKEIEEHDKTIKEHSEHLEVLDGIAKENTDVIKLLLECSMTTLSLLDAESAKKMEKKIKNYLIEK